MSEITPETIRQVLDLELDEYHGHKTVRAYLLALLRDVWNEGEGFDGKRPFGNSSWDYDLKVPMARAGLISGKFDSDGYVDTLDDETANTIILAAIQALDAPGQHAEPEPAKVIVVTEADGKERRYDADMWSPEDDGALHVHRSARAEDPIIARYERGSFLSVREEGAIVNDGPADKRKLTIAIIALKEIARDDPDSPGIPAAMSDIAREALADIADAAL